MLEPKVFITLDAEGGSLVVNGPLSLLQELVAALRGEQRPNASGTSSPEAEQEPVRRETTACA